MKSSLFLAALLACALPVVARPVLAQPDTADKPKNGLPFPLVSPADAEKMTLKAPLKLDFDNLSLADALDQLQTQSGVSLDYSNGDKDTLAKTLSLHIETPSFTRAFGEIMDEAGLKATLQNWNGQGIWTVAFGQGDETSKALQSEVGPFVARLMSLNTTLTKQISLDNDGDAPRYQSNFLRASLTLLPDLRLPLVGNPRTRLTRAEDDQGRSLIPKPKDTARNGEDYENQPYSFYENNGYGRRQKSLLLTPPASDAKTLAHLEGVLIYAVLTKTDLWEVPDLMSKTEWSHTFQSGDQKWVMTVKPTLKDGKNLTMNIEITSNQAVRENQINHPMMTSAPVMAALRIVDANGTIFRGNGGGGFNNQKLSINTSFYANNGNNFRRRIVNDEDKPKPLTPPLKMVFEAPVDVVQTEVPFSFEDVPLP